MSDDRTKSAIDAIYELLENLNNLELKVDNIDANIKLLNNKFNKVLDSQNNYKHSQPKASPGVLVQSQPGKDLKNVIVSSTNKSDLLVIGKIKTFGQILNKQKMPIGDVGINIYNDKNELIRNTKTNKDGFWEARLPSGRYGIEYIHSNFKPINLVINLDDSMKEYEVKK